VRHARTRPWGPDLSDARRCAVAGDASPYVRSVDVAIKGDRWWRPSGRSTGSFPSRGTAARLVVVSLRLCCRSCSMQWRWCVLLQDCRVRKGKSGRFGLAISCVEMSLVREKCYMLVVFFFEEIRRKNFFLHLLKWSNPGAVIMI
jgi:hypothetical protein